MSFAVGPGERFYVRYTSDGIVQDYAIPDITAQTFDVIVTINGIPQWPVDHFTVHQGTVHMSLGPVTEGYVVEIRS